VDFSFRAENAVKDDLLNFPDERHGHGQRQQRSDEYGASEGIRTLDTHVGKEMPVLNLKKRLGFA
jgi:hypothetical protein